MQASRPADAAEQTRLQTQAFEAINEVVRASAADTTPMVVQLIPLLVGKLQETLHMQGGGLEAAERQSEIQVGGWAGRRHARGDEPLPVHVACSLSLQQQRAWARQSAAQCYSLLLPQNTR